MAEARHTGTQPAPTGRPRGRRIVRRHAELATLTEIGRAIVQAQLDEDALCEFIYQLAGRIVPTDNFQLGLFEEGRYRIKVWVRDGQRQPPAAFPLTPGQGIIGWLAATGQSLLVNDFLAEMDSLPARPTYISQNPPRSAVFLPLVAGDAAIGALSIQSPAPHAFTEDHLRLLGILANQSAAALSTARLYRHNERRLNDLMTISEVGRKLTSILDLDLLLTQVVELIRSRFGYYHVQIFLVEAGSDRALFKASSGHQVGSSQLAQKWLREGRSMHIGREGIIGWVAQHGEPLLANDVSAEPLYIPDDPRLLPDTRAELAVPLIVEERVIGVLDVQSTQRDAFGPDDLFILRTLADQVAVAVNSARAYEAQREEAWVTTVLLQVAEATSQAESVNEVLDTATRVTAMLAGVESTAIWLWDDDSEVFEFGASFGLAWEQMLDEDVPGEDVFMLDELAARLRLPPGAWDAVDRLRAERTPVVIDDITTLPAAFREVCPGDTVALLPMLNKGQVFGVMGASFKRELAPALDERRLAMLSGIAHQVAAAVDNSRLTALREEEVWTSTVLLQVAEAIRRLQAVEVTLEQVARLVPALTGVDRCVALLLDETGNYRVRTVHALRDGLAEAYMGAVIRPGELPLLDDACRLGQPLVVNDTVGNPRVPAEWYALYGSRTILTVPLLVADEPIGAFLADDVQGTHIFSPRRVRIVTGIANQAAIAIENARLQAQEARRAQLARELELAHDIQRKLLPAEAPTVPGYQVVYRWRSAREVGGDFFDFVPLDEGRLGLVVADVADKGIPAALYMMFARTVLRAVALSGRKPVNALQRANELILAESQADMFVTVYYSVLDSRKHLLTYASAGHNLALYASQEAGKIEPMLTAGIPLGVVSGAVFGQKTLLLAPGDVVLFYTDGAIEVQNAEGEEFGAERLSAVLAEHLTEPAEAIAEAIDAAVQDFAGEAAQYDDFTLILVKREPDAD